MVALIEHSPDIYLDEIQDALEDNHGIKVSLSAIYRTLKRLGYSSKKACGSQVTASLLSDAEDHLSSYHEQQRNDAKKYGPSLKEKLDSTHLNTL